MRISFILSSFWLSGGVRCIVENANRLTHWGHKINIVIPNGTLDQDMASEVTPGVEIIQAKIIYPVTSPRISLPEKVLLSWSLAWYTPRSDVIISTQSNTTVAGFLATRILHKGQPVWYCQDNLEMYSSRPIERFLGRHALLWHKKALVVSHYLKNELERYTPGKDVVVSSPGISQADLFHPLSLDERHILNDGRRYHILFLGDMRPRKGLYDFLEAVKLVHQQNTNIHLWIVSKEDCRIQNDISFEYFYRPTRLHLARLYASCDLFVAASWLESFSLPALEAMACGAPVVLTNSGGVLDYAHPGENCLMVPPRDPKALAEAMIELLRNKELAEKFRRNGPITASKFTWETATDRFEAALKSLFQ